MEMRISLLFPLIVWFVRKYDWKTSLLMALVPSGIYFMIWRQEIHGLLVVHHNYFLTLRFIGFFIVGSLLAKYRIGLISFFKGLSRSQKATFLILSILTYTNVYWANDSWIWDFPSLRSVAFKFFIEDVLVSARIGGIIIVGLASRSIGGVLASKGFIFLGKISYSLYLYHLICLLSLMYLLYGKVPTLVILSISILLSLTLAIAGYYLVELPSMNVGRCFAKAIKKS